MSGIVLPVVAGLSIGVLLIVMFVLIFDSTDNATMSTSPNNLKLAIEGMKNTYKSGEQIVLSVSAKGISDNACNIVSPSVLMRDNGSGKTIYWPHPFGFSTAIGCNGSEPIDKIWTYGDDAKSEIILDKPGSYTLVASLEGVTIEKRFVVTN